MKKWIRWWGLLFFLVFSGLLAGGIWLFSGPLIAKGLETAGSQAVGARVDVGNVQPHFFPPGLELSGLQVTDPDAPMTNAVEIERIRMRLNAEVLLLRRLDVTEMAVEGIRLGTPRKFSGALPGKEKRGNEAEETESSRKVQIPMPVLQIPDVETVLSRESLAALEEVKTLDAELRAERVAFEARLQALPDAGKLDAYRARIEKLKKGGLESLFKGARELREIKAEVDRDIRNLRDTRDDLEGRIAEFRQRIRSLKSLAAEDINRLVAKYGISDAGMGNITGLLLGPEWEVRVRKGLWLYRKVQPWLVKGEASGATAPEPEQRLRGEGRDRIFAEFPARPDFLIRKATLSLHSPVGDLKGSLRNVTRQQHLLGHPLELDLAGEGLSGMERLTLETVFNRLNPEAPEDRFRIQVGGWQPGAMGTADFSLIPERGTVHLDAAIRGDRLQGEGVLDLTGVRFGLPEGKDPLRVAVTSALKDMKTLSVKVGLGGTLDRPELQFVSSLEGVVKKAVSRAARDAGEAFQKRLRQEVQGRTEGGIQELEARMTSLGDLKGILEEHLAGASRLSF